ncbi:hypothetical protein [Aquisphaera insulae]|uniref:hypothetical protein n=1 Tax=Aquisphaera insulae TaxID=2712864 RepID=UPI0013EE3CE2|nr:hypothetical protein [Aquisphaera insulae]
MRDDYAAIGLGRDVVLSHLEQGKPLNELITSPEATPVLVVGGIAAIALETSDGLGPTLVQHAPPRPKIEGSLSADSLAALFPRGSRRGLLALSAGLLQIHDFWDQSHAAAQEADDLGERESSAYWHAIAHRREPDAWNAAYWFRRVGQHIIFPVLGKRARDILKDDAEPGVRGRLLDATMWNPSAMIDLCTTARPGTTAEALAKRLQRAEMEILLKSTAAALQAD